MTKGKLQSNGVVFNDSGRSRLLVEITLPDGRGKSNFTIDQNEFLDWLIDRSNQNQRTERIADDELKLCEYLDRFMEDVTRNSLRPRTFDRNLGIVENHIKPEIGEIYLSALRPHQVQAFYTEKISSGLSKRSVKYIHAVLHKALDQARKWGLVTENVTDLVEKPRPDKNTFKTWSADQVNRFLEAVSNHRWYPIYTLAIYTGMRQGELLGLHREDISLDKGVLNVRHQISAIRGVGLVVTEPKTSRSRRPITLPSTALDILKSHLERTGIESGLIFTTSSGRPISPRNLLRHFKLITEQTGLPTVRFHLPLLSVSLFFLTRPQ